VTRRTEPDPSLPPLEALTASVTAYLGWVAENASAYRRLIESAGSADDARSLVQGVRDSTAERILEGLGAGAEPPPKARTAVRAWLWYMDGAILDWLDHRDLEVDELGGLLVGSLAGALAAADALDLVNG
jgi:AcrR family transcriptional regulator